MKRMTVVAAAVALLVFSGCTSIAVGPVTAAFTFTKGPVSVGDPSARATKVGKAAATGILIVAFGDASISAASKDGGITKIHHVDSEQVGILGIYAKSTTIVYGE